VSPQLELVDEKLRDDVGCDDGELKQSADEGESRSVLHSGMEFAGVEEGVPRRR
jgi:hypothetical protein